MASEKTPIFENVSPLDYRYYGRSREARRALKPYFSEEARIAYQARVEVALIEAFASEGMVNRKAVKDVRRAAGKVTAGEVYRQEDRIHHDIRALVNVMRAHMRPEHRRFVHLGLTSADVIDTANALRFRDGTAKVLLPELKRLVRALMALCKREAATLQIGRTHGQHAEPVTFGFAMAEYVERLGERTLALEQATDNLRGMASGAVGAHNTFSLIVKNPITFEKNLLGKLGLEPSRHSTQIASPEPLVDWAHACVSAFGVIANLADDLRHLQRSEIGEVYEFFGSKQVGSSTMPQKRNPINFENVKSFWKSAMPRMVTAYMDQISEHQRDLSNSASARFLPEIAVALYLSSARLSKVLKKLRVDKKAMKRNFKQASAGTSAEPLYILLAFHGHPNAHEAVRRLALKAQKTGESLWSLAQKQRSLSTYLERFTARQKRFVQEPEHYTGVAAKKALMVCRYWKGVLAR